MKVFYIDFIRQIIEQTLLEEHIKNKNYIGGENQVGLFSFYEQLQEQSEVDRYVEKWKDLSDQQNRMGLIANGILTAPENPSITNLNQCLIIPLSFMCAFRLKLEDRDLILDTINNLIAIHKGRKVDICEFDNGKLFMVGTLGNNVNGQPLIKVGDYVGEKPSDKTLHNWLTSLTPADLGVFPKLLAKGFTWQNFGTRTQYVYYEENSELKVARYDASDNTWKETNDDNSYDDIVFPPNHNSFTKYKVSLSFDALRCETPNSLNGDEVISISFGGSATIVSKSVMLGNDLTKLSIKKLKLVQNGGETSLTDSEHYLEPLEIPSSNGADTQLNRLMGNNFITNTHTDSLALSTRYTFIVDKNDSLLSAWFKYARYGTQTSITPNIIYECKEYFSEWGEVEVNTFKAKIVESIDIENTESDTLTITINMQVQGDNN